MAMCDKNTLPVEITVMISPVIRMMIILPCEFIACSGEDIYDNIMILNSIQVSFDSYLI